MQAPTSHLGRSLFLNFSLSLLHILHNHFFPRWVIECFGYTHYLSWDGLTPLQLFFSAYGLTLHPFCSDDLQDLSHYTISYHYFCDKESYDHISCVANKEPFYLWNPCPPFPRYFLDCY